MKFFPAKVNLRSIWPAGYTYQIIFLWVVIAVTACERDDEQDVAGWTGCKLTQAASYSGWRTEASVHYRDSTTFVYEYNHAGDIARESITYQTIYNYSKEIRLRNILEYQFDAQGFLLQQTQFISRSDLGSSLKTASIVTTYDYENGRAVEKTETEKSFDDQLLSKRWQYEYDDNGRLLNVISPQGQSTIHLEYRGDLISRMAETFPDGFQRFIAYEYNDAGLMTRATSSYNGDEMRYEYTADGQLSREEEYEYGVPFSGKTYEYDDKVNPWPSERVFKGVPVVPGMRPVLTQKHNTIRIGNLISNATGNGFITNSTEWTTYQYNDQGLPVMHGGSDESGTMEYKCQ